MEEFEKEDAYQKLAEYKKTFESLKKQGEKAISEISKYLTIIEKEMQEEEEELSSLHPIQILEESANKILFKYLDINMFATVSINLEQEKGYIEWGIFSRKNNSINYKTIYSDNFDINGEINEGLTTVDHAYELIPNAFAKIIDNIKNKNIYLWNNTPEI